MSSVKYSIAVITALVLMSFVSGQIAKYATALITAEQLSYLITFTTILAISTALYLSNED